MRSSAIRLLVAGISFACMASAQAQWTEAKIPGEQHRAAQGCAGQTRNPGDWVCILVRCDQPGCVAEPAFLHPGSGYPGQDQAADRRRTLRAFGAGFAAIAAGVVDAGRGGFRRSPRGDEGRKGALDRGHRPQAAPQPHLARELAQGDRADRACLRAPEPERRPPVAAPHRPPPHPLTGRLSAIEVVAPTIAASVARMERSEIRGSRRAARPPRIALGAACGLRACTIGRITLDGRCAAVASTI